MGTQLSREVMWQAKQMYEEVDPVTKRRRYSMMQVAAQLGISETSVLRAVKNAGRFANINATPLPPTRTEEMWAEETAASKERFLALQTANAQPAEKTAAQIYLDSVVERKPPPSPLDGGDAPTESEGAGLTKLVQVMKSGDILLEELNQSVGQPEKKHE